MYPLAVSQINAANSPPLILPGGIKPEDWDAFHDLIVIDEIARCGYLGIVWGLSGGNAIGVPPLINFGTREQKERFLPAVLAGKVRFCLGVTEPDGRELCSPLCGSILGPSNDELTWHADERTKLDLM